MYTLSMKGEQLNRSEIICITTTPQDAHMHTRIYAYIHACVYITSKHYSHLESIKRSTQR